MYYLSGSPHNWIQGRGGEGGGGEREHDIRWVRSHAYLPYPHSPWSRAATLRKESQLVRPSPRLLPPPPCRTTDAGDPKTRVISGEAIVDARRDETARRARPTTACCALPKVARTYTHVFPSPDLTSSCWNPPAT